MKNGEFIDFTMGTDSEFLCFNGKKLLNSDDYSTLEDAFGKDLNGKTFEIRSKPSTCPLEVVGSIKNIMQETVNLKNDYFNWTWLTRSYLNNLPLGTHIHFGTKKTIKPEKFIPYLDNYVGYLSLLLENQSDGLNRRKYNKSPGGNPVSYGKMGDFRLKPHGFEYRPIGSCMSSPYALAGILCLSKAVAYEYLNNPEFFNSTEILINPDDFINMNYTKLKNNFHKIWFDIQRMMLYPKYKHYIDFLAYLINNKISWNSKIDLKKSWGIIFVENKQPDKEIINLEKILQQHKHDMLKKAKLKDEEFINLYKVNFDELWQPFAVVKN